MIREGAVVFEAGLIRAVGSAQALRTAWPDARVIEAGESIVLPGLVNAHTHLELSACTAGAPHRGSFADWILGLRTQLAQMGDDPEQVIRLGTERGIEQCLRFGITTVGDISQQFHLVRPLLSRSPLRAVSYGEVLGLGLRRGRFEALLPGAIDAALATPRLRIGLSPHAPYTVDAEGYRQALQLSHQQRLPIATHLAETPDETEFLLHRTGAFRDLWDKLGFWSEDVPLLPLPPIRMAGALGLLDHPTLLAHVNYCDDEALGLLAQGRASVVYCPRTHQYFGHPPHRWREMLARGINVAVGTDSCASSPDLNLVEDLRLLHTLAPEIPPEQLWQMATIRAARALEWSGMIGSLTPGKAADLVLFEVRTTDPLRELLESHTLPRQTWIGGQLQAQPAEG